LRREGEKEDRIEARGLEFPNRVRNAFLDIALGEPDRFIVLYANRTREALHEEIVAVLRQRGLHLN
jgi:dTMP kinase